MILREYFVIMGLDMKLINQWAVIGGTTRVSYSDIILTIDGVRNYKGSNGLAAAK